MKRKVFLYVYGGILAYMTMVGLDYWLLPSRFASDQIVKVEDISYKSSGRYGQGAGSNYVGDRISTVSGFVFAVAGRPNVLSDSITIEFSPVFRQVRNVRLHGNIHQYKVISKMAGLGKYIFLLFFVYLGIAIFQLRNLNERLSDDQIIWYLGQLIITLLCYFLVTFLVCL